MTFQITRRSTASPFIDTIWSATDITADAFTAPAEHRLEMLITRQGKRTHVSLWGPSTHATSIYCPPDAEVTGIRFRVGVYLTSVAMTNIVNSHVVLPDAAGRQFILDHSAWAFPDEHNVEDLIGTWVRHGVLALDPVIESVLSGEQIDLSVRSVQRRFREVVGLSQRALHQIERAHHAATLLEGGASVLDTIHQIGYYDQPHLTRLLKRLLGKTPAQISKESTSPMA